MTAFFSFFRLCLANSERIKYTPYMHMVFEVQDLASASPATVSRYVVTGIRLIDRLIYFIDVVWCILIQMISDGVLMSKHGVEYLKQNLANYILNIY
jgi:hypothetical protein